MVQLKKMSKWNNLVMEKFVTCEQGLRQRDRQEDVSAAKDAAMSTRLVVVNQCDQIVQFFKVLGYKVPCKRSPNIQPHFQTIVKNGTFDVKLMWILLGNFCRKLDNFLPQHLVTLLLIDFFCDKQPILTNLFVV